MKISFETDLLKQEVRAQVIKDIEGKENVDRKKEAFKRYEIVKDKTSKYVEEMLLKQFDESTVGEMKYSIANISICRKIIDKLSRVYSYEVKRTVKKKKDQQKLDELCALLDINRKMQKANKALKLQKNALLFVKPQKCYENGVEYFKPKVMVLQPFLYDAIEDPNDKEKALAIILSSYDENIVQTSSLSPATEGRGYSTSGTDSVYSGNGRDELIADVPFDSSCDKDKKQYIFWTENFHFTTDSKGNIISGPEIENPIHDETWVVLADDQDGNFWAQGGSDLIDGSVLVNTMISNTNHIGVVQGYGQPVMTGADLPQRTKVGPNFMLKLVQKAGDPAPDFKYVSANPPLSELRELIVMYVSLLLTTNNLSTSAVSVSLESGASFASGVAMMLDKAESNEDVADQAKIFIGAEPSLFEIIWKWMQVYQDRNLLYPEFQELIPSNTEEDVQLKLGQPQTLISESERLDILQKKRDMGLVTRIDMLRAEYPGLTDDDLVKKLEELILDKTEQMKAMVVDGKNNQGDQGLSDEELEVDSSGADQESNEGA